VKVGMGQGRPDGAVALLGGRPWAVALLERTAARGKRGTSGWHGIFLSF